jgi:hypothetical protein
MIFSTTFALAALLLTHVAHALPHAEPSTRSTTARATFDITYDNPDGSLNNVACSDGGENPLAGRFSKFGELPTFPFIGGAPGIVWNSPNCGGCWKLTNAATGTWIIMTAIDSAATFNIAEEAFVTLNGGQVGQGVLEVVADQVDRSICGL